MSLDITLRLEGAKIKHQSSGIYIRREGQTIEISQEEWNMLHPTLKPVAVTEDVIESDVVFSGNITHNLGAMAKEAGLYEVLWRPEEDKSITKAGDLVEVLSVGLRTLNNDPQRYRALNPDNGWGTYDILIKFVSEYLLACIMYPEATIEASR